MEPSEQNEWKKAAAEAAARLVEDGMVLGLGTGSTAAYFVSALGRRLAEDGLRITGVPTSEQTATQARSLRIPLTSFAEHVVLDLTIDGADEVENSTLFLIKGHGGALLREKIVATASKRLVIVADESKLVERLGSLMALPVEVVRFGWQATAGRLTELGGNPSLRLGVDHKPFLTDGGNYIMDCAFGPIANPKEVAHHLDHVVGAIEHGLFLGLTKEVIVGGRQGVRTLRKG
ncbi:MAG TPA: ribose-5-phosphate isomerase RpiA [Candidatus Acidoferrales bacterium]|nr:ribose-5-phosphate isomerase RpiA [Candidatus Acidoferrales bacterium]